MTGESRFRLRGVVVVACVVAAIVASGIVVRYAVDGWRLRGDWDTVLVRTEMQTRPALRELGTRILADGKVTRLESLRWQAAVMLEDAKQRAK